MVIRQKRPKKRTTSHSLSSKKKVPKPIVAIETETAQLTSVANAVGLMIGVTAIVAVFIVIGTILFTAPAAPFLASVLDDTTTVTLRWTAPGDDGNLGQATAYDLRYSTSSITNGNFSSATAVSGVSAPKVAGGVETKVVSGLQPATTYYFAVKTVDENGNWSGLSNIVSHTTGCNPDWVCNDWSICNEGVQTRSCIDQNVCGDLSTRPPVSQTCGGDAVVCSQTWHCSQWSPCTSGSFYRNCVDLSLCGTSAGEPRETVSCSKTICRENWSCSVWSTCQSGVRTRDCVDLSHCGTTDYKPVTASSCSSVPPIQPQDSVIVAAKAAGSTPQVKVIRKNQTVRASFYAYEPGYRGGVTIATGDVDGDGKIEIVTGTGPNSAPHVRIFNLDGHLEGQFYAYSSFLRTGVNVAVADVNGDGRDDIITAPLGNNAPQVKVFRKKSTSYVLVDDVMAYASYFRGGVSLAADDLNGDGKAEIVVAPYSDRSAQVRVYSYATGNLKETNRFYGFNKNLNTGFDLAVIHDDGPLAPRIAIAPHEGGRPRVRIYRPNGSLVEQFYVASDTWLGGVSLSTIDVDQDGWDELVTGAFSYGSPDVYVFKYHFGVHEWRRINIYHAFENSFHLGIRVNGTKPN